MRKLTSVERRLLRYLISGLTITREEPEWYGFSSPDHSASFHVSDLQSLLDAGRVIDNNGTLEITPAGEYHYKHDCGPYTHYMFEDEFSDLDVIPDDDLSKGEFE